MSKENEPSIAELYQELELFIKDLIEAEKPFLERRTILRNHCRDLRLLIPDGDLFRIERKVRQATKGRSDGDLPNVPIEIEEEKWIWETLISQEQLNLVIALQKVGKSSLISAFLAALTHGLTDYLGQELKGGKRPLIIVGTDQPQSDWANILIPCGLAKRVNEKEVMWLPPIVRLWHKGNPLHLDEEGIETVSEVARVNPNSIVLLDAFSSLIRTLGLDEYKPEAVEPISALCEALSETRATPILLHHAGKGRDGERASNASRGSNALPAEASQIIQLNWLNPKNKKDQRIMVSTEGRNSKPVDYVFRQYERGLWESLGSTDSIREQEEMEKIEAKLNDRQSLALTEIREQFIKTFKGITAKDLMETYPEEWNHQNKALNTLNQLEKKGLCHSTKDNLPELGDVRIFKPPV